MWDWAIMAQRGSQETTPLRQRLGPGVPGPGRLASTRPLTHYVGASPQVCQTRSGPVGPLQKCGGRPSKLTEQHFGGVLGPV